MPTIHSTALVDPRAELADDVVISAFCIVEADVQIGAGCRIEARATIKNGARLGANNYVAEGTVLSGRPQHLRAGTDLGLLIVGEGNHFRENVTVHRGLSPGHDTIIGDGNFLMVGVHVGHDCRIGDNVIMANNVMLGGHVEVQDRAFLSGLVAAHQFCRIGAVAMVGGCARVTQDVPPFVMVDGETSGIVGLNTIGLRRAGMSSQDLAGLKGAYRLIFRSGLQWNEVLAQLAEKFTEGPAARYHEFLSASKRGILQPRREARGATIKLHPAAPESEDGELRKAG
ncbi:MAG: acyl-ACP--UDP-N-acetylglucosamine O-acyltransferase [Planctomycetales bacterium]|nr:acyl-ACP--UDP-N-acetylglucosamine O-acyltransferase [Planctomycetales bacterium]